VSQRDRLLLLVGVVAVALAGGWFLVIQPKRNEARDVDAQIIAARTQLAGTAGMAAQYRASRASLRKHPEVFVRAGRALPSRVAMPDLLRTLTKTARGTGVKIGDLTVGAGGASTTPGIGSVPLSLSFDGDFLALQRYLGRLQRFVAVSKKDVEAKGRLVSLDTVDMTPGDSGTLVAKVSATVYVMQPGALSATTSAPAAGATAGTPAPASTPTAGGSQ
jgi:Tfp pilus assembly protein PilO